jgi:hypothetical protein
MTSRQSILLLISLTMIAALVACGGSSSKLTTTTATLPAGNYVFSLAGKDNADKSPYYVAGVFTVANGLITGGEQDFVDSAQYGTDDQINPTGSSIAKTPDGNLLITLTTCLATNCTTTDNFVGVKGVETLNVSFLPLNPSKAFITEFDTSASASGELDLQTSTAALAHPIGYAFGLSGLDKTFNPLAIGGVINVDGPGAISGTGSIFDLNDNGVGGLFRMQTFTTSTVSAPDSLGRLTFTLNPSAVNTFPRIILIGYIVDANHIRLVETHDPFVGTLGGTALSQGANTGTFTSASVSGNSYVVGLTGPSHTGPFQLAALLTANPDLTLTGFFNYNTLPNTAGPQSPLPVAGTYTVDGPGSGLDGGTGRATLSITSPVNPNLNLNLQLYLDGSGHAMAISMDSTDILSGLGFQQSGGGSFTAASFSGAYVMDSTGADFKNKDELDAVGPITGAGTAGTFSGTADLNWLFSSFPGPTFPKSPVSGTFTSTANGVFTGTITGLDVTTCTVYTTSGPGCTADVFTFYLIDSAGDSIAIETDPNQLTLGFLSQK